MLTPTEHVTAVLDAMIAVAEHELAALRRARAALDPPASATTAVGTGNHTQRIDAAALERGRRLIDRQPGPVAGPAVAERTQAPACSECGHALGVEHAEHCRYYVPDPPPSDGAGTVRADTDEPEGDDGEEERQRHQDQEVEPGEAPQDRQGEEGREDPDEQAPRHEEVAEPEDSAARDVRAQRPHEVQEEELGQLEDLGPLPAHARHKARWLERGVRIILRDQADSTQYDLADRLGVGAETIANVCRRLPDIERVPGSGRRSDRGVGQRPSPVWRSARRAPDDDHGDQGRDAEVVGEVDLQAPPAERIVQALRHMGAATPVDIARRAVVTPGDARRICHLDDRVERRGAQGRQPVFGLTGAGVAAGVSAGDPTPTVPRRPPEPAARPVSPRVEKSLKRAAAEPERPPARGRVWDDLADGKGRTVHELSGRLRMDHGDVALEVSWLERHGYVRREHAGKYRRNPA